MDSQLDIVGRLIEEGKSFTPDHFTVAVPGRLMRSTHVWEVYRMRAVNAISANASENSPAVRLLGGLKMPHGGLISLQDFSRTKETIIRSLQLVMVALRDDVFGELRQVGSEEKSPVPSNRVFVVHGHDDGLKTDMERFLLRIGLDPVVLHREADEGATLIEKFEKHSDVGYAFILLTPDDVSYPVAQEALPENKRNKEHRARQNVIFEFGYFVGKLERNRVCCILKGNVTRPSDLEGIIYKPVGDSVDSQGQAIIKELKAAGYDIKGYVS